MAFEDSLATKLRDVFGHDRVYDKVVPMTVDGDDVTPRDGAPCVTYKLKARPSLDCINSGQSADYESSYLIEMFAQTGDDATAMRDLLQSEFQGPVVPGNPVAWARWIPDGSVIHWAECHDVEAGEDLLTSDAHDVLEFCRAVLVITHEEP